MNNLTLILGGAKSGKTKAALNRANSYQGTKYYLATAQAHDEEMHERIDAHKKERGEDWLTLEEPLEVPKIIRNLDGNNVLLLDCITLWLSNLLTGKDEPKNEEILEHVNDLINAIELYKGPVIIVSNEVGGGIVPLNYLARKFVDLSGMSHQLLARAANEVYLVTAGLEQRLK